MRLEETKIQNIIRYWVLLEDLKRHKAAVFGKLNTEEKSSEFTLWRTPEELSKALTDRER